MSVALRVKDFFVWMGEMIGGPKERTPPPRALGIVDGAVSLMRWNGSGYVVERRAEPGDRLPLYLDENQALALRFEVSGEAALHGADAAEIEAARRCPFPLADAAWRLERARDAWRPGAAWRLVAAPRAKMSEATALAAGAGARADGAFAVVDGVPTRFEPPRARLGALAAGVALLAGLAAFASVEIGAGRMVADAEARLEAARRALDDAERSAAEAESAREAEAAPIRAALAASAALTAAPPAGEALARLTAAVRDEAHARRLRISPRSIEGEFVSPDAAALAASLAGNEVFRAAKLKTAARVDQGTGLQRAVLDIARKTAP